MRRHLALFTVLVLGLTSCTQDPPGSDPSETPAPTAAPTLSETDDEPSASEEPSEEPSATESPSDEPTDDPSATEEPTDKPTPAASETDADGGTTTALGTWNRSSATRDGGNGLSSGPAVTRAWSGQSQGNCQVAAGAGETINECVSVRVASKDGTLTVTDTSDTAGNRSVRVFRTDSTGNNVSTLSVDGAANRLHGSQWPNGDGLIAITLPTGRYVVGWIGAEPSSVADFGPLLGGETLSFLAGHIVRRVDELGGGELEVLRPGASGSTGIKVSFSSSDAPPTDVALRVYRAWITGDFAAMNGLATEKVINALRESRTTSDLFTLQGSQCSLAANQATCTFTSNAGSSTWTLERLDGRVQVTKLA